MFGPDLFHMRNTDRYDIFFRPIDYFNRIKRGGAVWHLQILKSIKIQSLFYFNRQTRQQSVSILRTAKDIFFIQIGGDPSNKGFPRHTYI